MSDGQPKRSLVSFMGMFAPPVNAAPIAGAVWRTVTRYHAFCPGAGCDYQFPEDHYRPWEGDDFEAPDWEGVRACPRCGQRVGGTGADR